MVGLEVIPISYLTNQVLHF